MEIRGRTEEVISIEFADRVTLHVPLQDAHLLTRYVGLSRGHPKARQARDQPLGQDPGRRREGHRRLCR
jgi:transcription-repair coupling factor (superfamily II helicase)